MDILLATNLDLAKGYTDTKLTQYKNEWESVWKEDLEKAIAQAAIVEANSAKWNQAYEWVNAGHTDWDRIKDLVDEKSESWEKATELVENITKEYQDGWDVGGETKAATIQDVIDYFKTAGGKYADDIAALNEKVSKILEAMKTEVTGIEIQGTYNPIYGTFAYPVGIQSNLLALYYGKAGELGVKFPAADGEEAAYWANQTPCVTADELEALDPDYFELDPEATLMDTDKGNAGTLYLTVNPSNVDFDGTMFTLRSSDNKVSKVQLSELKDATDEVLKWGYRRATANSSNGFYKASATVSEADVKDVALSFKLKDLAPQAKAILEDWKSASAADVAKLGLAVMNAMKTDVPRLGVQYQWKDAASGEWKNYVSKYDLAAVSVQPVGYKFLDDLTGKMGPQVEKIRDQVTAKERAFEKDLESWIKIQLNLPDQTTATFKVVDGRVYIVVPGQTVTTPGGDIDIDPKEVEVTAMFEAINSAIATQTDAIKGNMQTLLDKLIAKQNKVFNKVASVVNNPNRYVQPALLAYSDAFGGYFYPSRIHTVPTEVKKGTTISFYPTTLTAEVLAPAFKKYVAITGVWKLGNIFDTKPAKPFNDKGFNVKDQNKVLNEVFDGNQYNLQNEFQIDTNILEPGYVYEFTYECLDYTGLVAGKKYYITIFE
jgi:hypothetical protein